MNFAGMKTTKYLVVWSVLVLAGLVFTTSSIAGDTAESTLLDQIVALKLGMQGYTIGVPLAADQKKAAQSNPSEGAYEGTYKFSDKDLFVVVDQKSDRVLALYKQKKEADKKQLKTMVIELMELFDAPTTLAHDKILYWAYNKHGAISEEDFNKAKEIKQTTALGIIATVKLNSEMDITPDPIEEESKTAEKKEAPAGSVYFIITSDPLVKQFIADHS